METGIEKEIAKLEKKDAELHGENERIGRQRIEIRAEIARLKKRERRFTLLRRLASNPGDQNGYLWFDAKKKLFVYSDHSADGQYGKVGTPDQTDDGVLWLTGQSWIEARAYSDGSDPSITLCFDVTSERDGGSYKIGVMYAAGMEIIELCQFSLPHSHHETPMARALGLLVRDPQEMVKVRRRISETARVTMRGLGLKVRDAEPEAVCYCSPGSHADTCVQPDCRAKKG